MVVRPYPIWGPLGSANPLAKAQHLPTANPPPEYVSAALAFDVVNLGTEDIPYGWNVTITNTKYIKLSQVSFLMAML